MSDEVTKAKAQRWERQMGEAIIEAVKAHVAEPGERARVFSDMAARFEAERDEAHILDLEARKAVVR